MDASAPSREPSGAGWNAWAGCWTYRLLLLGVRNAEPHGCWIDRFANRKHAGLKRRAANANAGESPLPYRGCAERPRLILNRCVKRTVRAEPFVDRAGHSKREPERAGPTHTMGPERAGVKRHERADGTTARCYRARRLEQSRCLRPLGT